MASSSRIRGQRQAQHVYSSDSLSQLPEEIQRQILSFLPTSDAARTGFCSKLLWTAWRSLPKLIFDYYQFPVPEPKINNFVRFINRTLACHDGSDVTTFKLFIWPSMDCYVSIDLEWIIFAIAHNVENLVLCGRLDQFQNLPDCMFTCQSLVKLELAVDKLFLEWPQTFELPNLRKLKLKFMLMSYPEIRRDLFSCFPSLEKLSIMFCYFGRFTNGIYISSSKLKEFVICYSSGMESCCFSFETTQLSKFIYICSAERESELVLPDYTFGIIINAKTPNVKSANAHELDRAVVKLSRELLKGYYLKFSHLIVEYLCNVVDLPKQAASFGYFYNLHILDMDIWPYMEHVVVMILLISKCPCLIALSLQLLTPERDSIYLPYLDQDLDKYVYEGGFRTVSHFNIMNFGGNEVEMAFVETFLAHASNLILTKIEMNAHMAKDELEDNISRILAFKKTSEFGNVIFT